MTTKLWLIIGVLFGSFVLLTTSTYAQTYDSYIWLHLTPTNITGAEDLQSKLETEVNKIITAGHLAPFRALYGEGQTIGGQYYWYQRYATIYTLSLAYPYLSGTTQTKLATYLKSEIASFPPWNAALLPATGTKRQNDFFPPNVFEQEYAAHSEYANRPQLFALYATWLYAYNTGDWSTINTNWSAITSYNSSKTSEVGKYYSSIAGSIGLARMALVHNDSTIKNNAITDAITGFTNGKNVAAFATNALTAYQYACGEEWSYCQRGSFPGFYALDMVPEIGRYLNEDNVTRNTIVGSSNTDTYSLTRAEFMYPLWYMAQAPAGTIYFGEGSGNPPDTRGMVFPLKAWVQKVPPSELRQYLDVPDALVGDYYYLQNLVRTIGAHGTECWEDLRTTTSECSGSNPPPVKTGDLDKNGFVDFLDILYVMKNFSTYSIFTFNQIISNYGK